MALEAALTLVLPFHIVMVGLVPTISPIACAACVERWILDKPEDDNESHVLEAEHQ